MSRKKRLLSTKRRQYDQAFKAESVQLLMDGQTDLGSDALMKSYYSGDNRLHTPRVHELWRESAMVEQLSSVAHL